MKKFIIITLSILGALVVIFVLLLLLLLSEPVKYSYTVAQAEADSLLVSEIADMISDAVVDKDGNIPEIAEIVIPPEHAGALFRLAECRVNVALKDDEITCTFEHRGATEPAESRFSVTASYPMPLSTALVLRGTVQPFIDNSVLHLPVTGLKLGHLPLSNSVLPFGEVITEKDIECEAAKLALAAVHALAVMPDGSLKIGIYPAKVSDLTRFLIMGKDGD